MNTAVHNAAPAAKRAPVMWSVAGTDSGGGAGLAADQRAADAMGVHLCGVVAAVTAQNSLAVERVEAMPTDLLDAQMAALAEDMPPAAIKTGLLGSADNVRCVARWVDRLRQRGAVALVVDPVLRASTGRGFADAAVVDAYREWLLPRASVLTPNRREAAVLLNADEVPASAVPAQAAALQALGVQAVCITGGDAEGAWVHDWLASPQARGWLATPRVATRHTHGTGCTHASALAAALALGFVAADAAVLARMQVLRALRNARAVGSGAGPVRADAAGGPIATDLPWLSFDDAPAAPPVPAPGVLSAPDPGVYAIVDSAARVEAVLAAGAHTVQLRIKAPADADKRWQARLRLELAAGIAAARGQGITLYINDHWRPALELGAAAVHLGQEDLAALTPLDRKALGEARRRGLRLGVSSHSLWELCRAAAMRPDYIACGPVWPTETKRMPWQPQGLHNLAWWAAHAPAPVVAIGGILEPDQLAQAAQAGARGACLVRGLGEFPASALPGFLSAWQSGLAARHAGNSPRAPQLPHPSLHPVSYWSAPPRTPS